MYVNSLNNIPIVVVKFVQSNDVTRGGVAAGTSLPMHNLYIKHAEWGKKLMEYK